MNINITPFHTRSHLVDMRVNFDASLPAKINGLVGLYSPLQKFIDHEILRTIDPYVPMRTGTLKRSATIHSIMGSGEIRWVTPYARKMYFKNPGPESPRATGHLRGKFWIERWQTDGWVGKILESSSRKFGFGGFR